MNKRSQQLNRILSDNKSGSSEILLRLKKYILKNIYDERYVRTIIDEAEKKLFHFASINNFLKKLKNEIRKSDYHKLEKFLKKSIQLQEKEINNLFERNRKYLIRQKSITTLSYSKSLLEVLKLLYKENPGLKIFIMESRPMYEGRIFAKELIKVGFDCTILIDAMMSYAVANSDAVIVGADQILKNGNVVNKVGSYALSLCAKEMKKPFYVVATKDKIINSRRFVPEQKNFSEVWNYKNKKLRVINFYFEVIPKKLITKILTD